MDIVYFENEPLLDWSRQENKLQMEKALKRIKEKLGKSYPLIIGGRRILTRETIRSINPANFNEVVGIVAKANSPLANQAVEAASGAKRDWARVSIPERIEYLFKAAKIMRKKRFELMSWIVFEAGKNWKEADADVAEAIDFLEYYGRQMSELGKVRLTGVRIPGEINQFCFAPRGIGLVLGIWNFPLAINVGMCSASIVTGNTVIFKPASLTPVIGYKMVEIFEEAGLPKGVLNYLPGSGQDVGEHLVRDPEINFIVLTGSREIGLRTNLLAALYPHRQGIKKVIAETGGKNAIIIDRDADLDEVVKGVIISWLGFQGQKCSACSRVIIFEDIHDRFLVRLIEATKSIKIGDPQNPSNFMGPMIDEWALKKVQKYVKIGKEEGKLVLEIQVSQELKNRGYYHGPVIFTNVNPMARIAQEEIFGPVLVIIKVKNNIEEALEIANSTGFALTGGMYSRNPTNIKKAKQEFDVGNLYINRPITGALVGRQPFGGHRGSGTGPKAGGPEYLKAFMVEKTLTENIIRRGFAPLEDL